MDPFDYLPAWRWLFPQFHSNFGLGDGITQMTLWLAQQFFNAADVVWFILLWVVKLATEMDIVKSAGGSVDKIVHAVATPIVGDPILIGFLIVMIATWSVYRGLRHGLNHAVRKGLAAFIPLAILALMFHAAASDNGTGKVVLSPAWIAQQVDTASNQLGSIVPAGLSSVQATKQSGPPTCSTYEMGLTTKFASASQGSSDTSIPETVSILWQQSYLYAWGAAQFGDPDVGARVSCRYLESTNNVAGSTQSSIEATGDSQTSDNPPATKDSTYGPLTGDPLTASVTAWAACSYSGGNWSVTSAGQLNAGDGPTATDCAKWWGGDAASATNYTNGAGFCSGCNGQTQSQISSEGAPNHTSATTFLDAYNGHNAGLGVIYGFFALLSSLAYAVAIGTLALGTFLAQFLLIATLCALPVLLLAMATTDRAGSVAKGMLKTGFKAMVAKIIFLLILGLLSELIVLVNSLISSSGTGFAVVLVTAVAPLLAFYALHLLLRQVGMHGMLSIRGSILTTAGIATGHHRRSRDDAPRPGLEAMGNRARNNLRNRLGSRSGGRGPDASRPGGARPPESGTRSDPSLYGTGGGKKKRPGGLGPTAPNGTSTSEPSMNGTDTGGASGAAKAGAVRGAAAKVGAVRGAAAKVGAVRGAAAKVGAAGTSARQRFAAFRAPEAVAARKQARSRAYHTGLGLLSMAPGRGAMLAAGTAGAVAHAGRAKAWVGQRRAAIAEQSGRRANSREIHNQIRSITDKARGRQLQRRVDEKRAGRVARIEGMKDRWRLLGERSAETGKFHADFARHRASNRLAGLGTDRQRANGVTGAGRAAALFGAARRSSGRGWAANVQGAYAAGAQPNATSAIGRGAPSSTRTRAPRVGGAGQRKPPRDAGGTAGTSGRAQPKGTMPNAPRRPARQDSPAQEPKGPLPRRAAPRGAGPRSPRFRPLPPPPSRRPPRRGT